jgi:hypothetical protein
MTAVVAGTAAAHNSRVEDEEGREDRSTLRGILSEGFTSWFEFYVVVPVTAGVGIVAGAIVWSIGLSSGLVIVATVGVPVLLFFLPYKNDSEQLRVALALIGSGWFVLLALWDVWWAGGVVLGLLVLATGLLIVGAGRRASRP